MNELNHRSEERPILKTKQNCWGPWNEKTQLSDEYKEGL